MSEEVKAMLSARIPANLLERLRRVSFWTGASVATLAARGLEHEVATFEKLRGGEFPPCRGKVPTNRPRAQEAFR